MTQSKCCEKCEKDGGREEQILYCSNPSCECHQSAEKQCTCASFFTVRGVHKKDCPLFTDAQCNCAHFQTQIVNATEGSYINRFDWHCPVHGSLHKDFETPEGFAPTAEKKLLPNPEDDGPNAEGNNTYTCEHGVVQPIGTHSHAPVSDTAEKKPCNCLKAHVGRIWYCDCSCHLPTTDTSDWRVWALSLLFVSLAVGGGFLLAWATDNN